MHIPGWLLAVSTLLQALGSDAADPPPMRDGPCHGYAEVARQLSTTYDETPMSLGIQTNGNLLLVFNSASGGSWTIVSASPTGLSCILAAGQHWEFVAPVQLGSPA